jgi:hypothetical protein
VAVSTGNEHLSQCNTTGVQHVSACYSVLQYSYSSGCHRVVLLVINANVNNRMMIERVHKQRIWWIRLCKMNCDFWVMSDECRLLIVMNSSSIAYAFSRHRRLFVKRSYREAMTVLEYSFTVATDGRVFKRTGYSTFQRTDTNGKYDASPFSGTSSTPVQWHGAVFGLITKRHLPGIQGINSNVCIVWIFTVLKSKMYWLLVLLVWHRFYTKLSCGNKTKIYRISNFTF